MAAIRSFSIISRSLLIFAQFVEHHIPQVVQRFSQLHRVDQGTAGPVIAVQTVQILSRDQKGGDPAAVVSDLHLHQISPVAQQKCTLEQIGDFNGTFQRNLTSFQTVDFLGKMR
jgi:hypothetical protein